MQTPMLPSHFCLVKTKVSLTTNTDLMKNKIFLLVSIIFSQKSLEPKSNQLKEWLLNIVEEVGAWIFLGGFVLGIFWIIGILLGAEMS